MSSNNSNNKNNNNNENNNNGEPKEVKISIELENFDEAKKKFDEIEEAIEKLEEEKKVKLKLEAETTDDKTKAEIEKEIEELQEKIDTLGRVEIQVEGLTEAEKKIDKLEAEKILLGLEIKDVEDDEIKIQLEKQVEKINSQLSYLNAENGVYEFSASIDKYKISSYVTDFKTYAYGMFDEILDHINQNRLDNITESYNDEIAKLNKKYGIEEELYVEYLNNIKIEKSEYENSISEMEKEKKFSRS